MREIGELTTSTKVGVTINKQAVWQEVCAASDGVAVFAYAFQIFEATVVDFFLVDEAFFCDLGIV